MPSAGSLIPSDPTNVKSTSTAVASSAGNLLNTGASLETQGQTGLQPVLTRLMSLLSGDPTQIDQATRPQTTAVIKQYDTAKKNSAQFAPRGGGQTSANIAAGAQEASDIGNVKSQAVTDASTQLGQIASAITGQGVQASEAGTAALGGLVQSALQGEKLSDDQWSALGGGLFSIIGDVFKAGGWGALFSGA